MTAGCSRCGLAISFESGACVNCLEECKRINRERSNEVRHPQDDPVPEPLRQLTGTEKELEAIKVGSWLIQKLIASLPCSGNTAIWKDDESGASGSWDNTVRLMEEMR